MKNLAFNPDTMTVSDLKEAANALRSLIQFSNRDCWETEDEKLEAVGLQVEALKRSYTAD